MQRELRVAVAVSLLCGLAACGGGGAGDGVSTDPLAVVPASAGESSAGLTGYIEVLASMPSDTREPVAVDRFVPPQPDTTEPEPVNR